jgi:hypothetical protein
LAERTRRCIVPAVPHTVPLSDRIECRHLVTHTLSYSSSSLMTSLHPPHCTVTHHLDSTHTLHQRCHILGLLCSLCMMGMTLQMTDRMFLKGNNLDKSNLEESNTSHFRDIGYLGTSHHNLKKNYVNIVHRQNILNVHGSRSNAQFSPHTGSVMYRNAVRCVRSRAFCGLTQSPTLATAITAVKNSLELRGYGSSHDGNTYSRM